MYSSDLFIIHVDVLVKLYWVIDDVEDSEIPSGDNQIFER